MRKFPIVSRTTSLIFEVAVFEAAIHVFETKVGQEIAFGKLKFLPLNSKPFLTGVPKPDLWTSGVPIWAKSFL